MIQRGHAPQSVRRHAQTILVVVTVIMCAAVSTPARAAAKPGACYAACSKLYLKHISAVAKCVAKNVAKSGACSYGKLAFKTFEKWTAPNPSCSAHSCALLYPSAGNDCYNWFVSISNGTLQDTEYFSTDPDRVGVDNELTNAGLSACVAAF